VAANLHWIKPSDPPDRFPDPERALTDPNGLLAVGGDLSIERLLVAYQLGIFPWYQDDQPILWWSPNPRAVLFPRELHVSRSLQKTLRQNRYAVSVDQDFAGVITGCANERTDTGTWITTEMEIAYQQLHEAGHAHAIEIWCDGQLAGGLYGVNIGHVFFGESMFSRQTDASKVALVQLANICLETGIGLVDCQLASTHLASLGSREIARSEFRELLRRYTQFPSPTGWARSNIEARELLPRTKM
jgi:leucyl/phenylalanyl-tRNA--protein transferase